MRQQIFSIENNADLNHWTIQRLWYKTKLSEIHHRHWVGGHSYQMKANLVKMGTKMHLTRNQVEYIAWKQLGGSFRSTWTAIGFIFFFMFPGFFLFRNSLLLNHLPTSQNSILCTCGVSDVTFNVLCLRGESIKRSKSVKCWTIGANPNLNY